MAAADYYLCDSCFRKTYYDTDVEYTGVGIMRVLCPSCTEFKTVIIIEKDLLEKLKTTYTRTQ